MGSSAPTTHHLDAIAHPVAHAQFPRGEVVAGHDEHPVDAVPVLKGSVGTVRTLSTCDVARRGGRTSQA